MICYELARDLRDNGTANIFIDDVFIVVYIDEIVQLTVACARSKGDWIFTTRVEISAYLGLNILIGIHEPPQLAMYWDYDEFLEWKASRKRSQSTASSLWGHI